VRDPKKAMREGYFGAFVSAQLAKCVRDERGGTEYAEYLVLVGVVALACTTAFLSLGLAVARDFQTCRSYVLYPVP